MFDLSFRLVDEEYDTEIEVAFGNSLSRSVFTICKSGSVSNVNVAVTVERYA